jgi:predicted kinase
MKTAILTIGKTHSGKSSFAKKLSSVLPQTSVIEMDAIAFFLEENFPRLHELDNEQHGALKRPPTKYRIFKTILTDLITSGQDIVLANANLSKKVRSDLVSQLKESSYKTIGVYLDFPEKLLLERIKTSDRDTRVLTISKSFEELLLNQRAWLEPPLATEFDHFFEISDESQMENLIKSVKQTLIA